MQLVAPVQVTSKQEDLQPQTTATQAMPAQLSDNPACETTLEEPTASQPKVKRPQTKRKKLQTV